VPLSGYDVWRIATAQRLPPQQFLVSMSAKNPDPETFRLRRDGIQFRLALEKRGEFVPDGPCVFLVELGGGHSRCGIYPDRPHACQVYPMSISRGILGVGANVLCPPDSWLEEDLALRHWRDAHRRMRRHWDVYIEVVRRWNAYIDALDVREQSSLTDYLTYLMNVYAALADLDARIAPGDLIAVDREWRNAPTDAGPPLWLRYFRELRDVIDGFFPRIAPLPMLVVATETTAGRLPPAVQGTEL
jgi:Fe-S-cluster containining protein